MIIAPQLKILQFYTTWRLLGSGYTTLERGPFLPCEKENWDTTVVFNSTRYFGPEVGQDRDGAGLRAGIHCSTWDGYRCLIHSKSDAEISVVRPVPSTVLPDAATR